MINPRWVIATTTHHRFAPIDREFSYPVPFILVDVADIGTAATQSRLFSLNRWNVTSIHDVDYLNPGRQSISDKLSVLWNHFGVVCPKTTLILTCPRVFCKAFNPVTFFFGVSDDGRIHHVIAEVTNTYNEKHIYLIDGHADSKYISNTQKKTFHVSPFLDDSGYYKFQIGTSIDEVDIHITYLKNNTPIFYANLIQKETYPMTTLSTAKTLIRLPFGILGIFPRILKHAGILHYFRKINASPKPVPTHPDTIRKISKPPRRTMFWPIVSLILKRLKIGALEVIHTDGSRDNFGLSDIPPITLTIRDDRVFRDLVLNGEIGLGESYVNGFWDTGNLTGFIELLIKNKVAMKTNVRGSIVSKSFGRIKHYLNSNTVKNSIANIQSHYDLSNAMYATFLDRDMNYSCALFRHSGDTLEIAQKNKLMALFDPLRITRQHHVLEIGSGWGDAAITLAKTYGCKVTTLTLSQAQFEAVQQKIQDETLSHLVDIRLEDYRHHVGTYDRIISIEMIEAVGYAFLGTYFASLDRLLAPSGLVGIQAITIPDQRYASYRRRQDWIQKHIFPGGHLPSFVHILECIRDNTGFVIDRAINIGPHYGLTLAEWRRRFLANEPQVRHLGFGTDFIRKWTYYLSYCEAGFNLRYINTHHIILTRPVTTDLINDFLNDRHKGDRL